jgi:hypothetical protein
MRPKPDVRVENHGSIVLLRPVTGAASAWLDENLASDAMSYGGATVCEPRYVQPIIDGMQEAGLVVLVTP